MKKDTTYYQFNVSEGREISGGTGETILKWGGEEKSYKRPWKIAIKGSYKCTWKNYPADPKYGDWKYLLLEVKTK